MKSFIVRTAVLCCAFFLTTTYTHATESTFGSSASYQKEGQDEALITQLHRQEALEKEIRTLERDIAKDRWMLRTGGVGGARKTMAASRLRQNTELVRQLGPKREKLVVLKQELETLKGNQEFTAWKGNTEGSS